MLETAAITEEEPGLPATLVFRIGGRVSEIEMKMLSDRLLDAFDRIDLLLVFDRFEGAEPGAGLNSRSLKANAASLWNVRAYVAAGAPEEAGEMIERIGRMLPVDARTFDTEAEARAYLTSLPHPP